jgi:hypothetical protein
MKTKKTENGRQLSIEYLDLQEIAKWPRNPKDHDVSALRASFGRFGFVNPVIVNETNGHLLVGHGRVETLEALQAAGAPPPDGIQKEGPKWLVPVVRGVYIEDDEHGAYVIADNRLVELGGWGDEGLLLALLQEIDERSGVEGTGFRRSDMEKMLSRAQKAAEKETGGPDEMDLRAYEHYDYIVLVFRDQRDWLNAVEKFGLRKVLIPHKQGSLGLGRVVEGSQVLGMLKE